MCFLGTDTLDTAGGWLRDVGIPSTQMEVLGSHLHRQDEAVAVQGVLPVQQTIQSQSSTDVVQGKDAVGIPCKERSILGVTGAQDRQTWGWDHSSSWVLRMSQTL